MFGISIQLTNQCGHGNPTSNIPDGDCSEHSGFTVLDS
jgi:hypothetical protein